ncbi:MAG: YbhB/YbcL family Raf kinase inhibitor-like protein [Rhodanobacteraceae bacterium]|nr:YbhB/YbcL family Raf kinase inhibitor-like protein [Rhodanobacteraceae bacterium]
MRIHSDSFTALARIPGEYAFGIPGVNEPMALGANRNPHLAWDGVPDATRSFALICVDDDVPAVFDDANQPGRVIRADLPRRDFIHWVMVDIPSDLREIAAGSCSDGVVEAGKRNPPGPPGVRQGINDYGATHHGYDGPCPPWNDERLHHYHFRLYALDLPSLAVGTHFTAADALRAMHGHVLAMAELTGTYTLNPAL